MLAPFAPLQQRVNSAMLARLANASVQVGDGEPFAALFDQPYADPFAGQIDAASPTLWASVEQLAGIERNGLLRVDGRPYLALTVEPDGTGMALLTLAATDEPAAPDGGDLDPDAPDGDGGEP
jgi:hypothetical protein